MQLVDDFGELKDKFFNRSGILPVEYKVLVKIKSDDKTEYGESKTKGGIIIAKQTTEREEMAKVEGTLIDIGGSAFDDWKGLVPKPGDQVLIAKYAGSVVEGLDEEEYRLCSDKDIAAIIKVSK